MLDSLVHEKRMEDLPRIYMSIMSHCGACVLTYHIECLFELIVDLSELLIRRFQDIVALLQQFICCI